MRFALLFITLLGPVTAWGLMCGPSVSKEDRFVVRIKDTSASADPTWNNHLAFLYYFKILDSEAEIEVPTWRLEFGHRDTEKEFVESVGRIAKSPSGNLILRFYIRWAKRLAQEFGGEERAGEFFLGLLNAKGLRYYEPDGTLRLGADSVSQFVQKLSFDTAPGLSEMEMILLSGGSRELIERRLLGYFYVALRRLAPLWTPGKLPPRELVETGMLAQLRMFHFLRSEMQPTGPDEFRLEFEPDGEGRHFAEFRFRGHHSKLSYFPMPSMGGNLHDLVKQQGALVRVDGRELVAMLPLSLKAAGDFFNDSVFFERLFYPWLRDLGCFSLMNNVASALSGPEAAGRDPVGGAPKEPEPNLSQKPKLLRERAIAHALSATYALGGRNVDRNLSDMMTRMIVLDPEASLGYGTIERISRKYRLPVHVMAQNEFPFPLRFVWPPVERFESRTYAPTHAIVVYGARDSESATLLASLNLTAEKNLDLLDNYAGIGLK